MTLRDAAALEDIIKYCDRIGQYIARCGDKQECFDHDTMVQDACCMCIVQIGELTGHLSNEVKATLAHVPWRLIKETRNFYVHNYGNISKSLTWLTIKESIPALKEACVSALEKESEAALT